MTCLTSLSLLVFKDFLAETAFKEMDEDRDGKVTIDEFVGACMKQVKVSLCLSLPNDARSLARMAADGAKEGKAEKVRAHPTE